MKLKKFILILSAVAIYVALSGCNANNITKSDELNTSLKYEVDTPASINSSPDKYTVYVKDYVGRNCASIGTTLSHNIYDSIGYGNGAIYLNLISNDGSYVDTKDDEILKKYVVTGQSIEPNTEIKLKYKKDTDGKELDHEIEFQSIEEIDLYVTLINNDDASVESTINESKTVTEKSNDETTTTSKKTVTEEEKTSNAAPNGIRPEFKEALDSYEAFYDEYCDIMKKYMENPLDMSILTEYYEFIEKAEEMDEKLEALDDSEWSDEETKYYLEVTTRVTTKMLEIYQ